MIRINLLRETALAPALDTTERPHSGLLLVLMLVLLALGMGWWYYQTNTDYSNKMARKQELEQEKQRLATARTQEVQYKQQKADLDNRISVILKLKSQQKGPVQLLNSIIASVPDRPTLWLDSVAQKGLKITLEGHSFDVPSIADLIASLNSKKIFQKVELQNWEEEKDAVLKFEVVCTLAE